MANLNAGSGTVRVNSIAVGRIGDSADLGAMTSGSGNVFAVNKKNCINITVMANYDGTNTNKSKKSVRTYVDLDRFCTTSVTNDIVKIEDVNGVKRSVKNLINTQFYERPFHQN